MDNEAKIALALSLMRDIDGSDDEIVEWTERVESPEITGNTEYDLGACFEQCEGSPEYFQNYKSFHNCEIITIPRRTPDTSFFSFMSSSIHTLSTEDGNNLISDLRQIERDHPNPDARPDLHVYLNTNGGNLATAEIIVKVLLRYPKKVYVFVDNMAMSAGTLIALTGHEIYLRSYAHLGQIDPQIGAGSFWIPTNSIRDQNIDDYETTWIKDFARFASGPCLNSCERVTSLLERIETTRGWSDDFMQSIVENLLVKLYGHDMPYDYYDLSEFWINEGNNPTLHDEWPESALLLKRVKKPDIPPKSQSNPILSFLGM